VNITAALEAAQLRPDLTQELSGVYASTNPDAYPLSAYSYLVTQCSPSGDRPTCKGPYADGGVATSMAQFMRMIACDGQVEAAALGYSPLPPNLSQEMANAIGRMLGQPPEQLHAGNCSNPRFRGNDPGPGGVAPPDPVEQRRGQAGGGTQAGGGATGADPTGKGPDATAADATQGPGATAADSESDTEDVAAAIPGRRKGAGADWLNPAPVVYDRPAIAGGGLWLVLALLLILVVPTAAAGAWLALRRTPPE
jgi:phosphate transport system substrate-binding protein